MKQIVFITLCAGFATSGALFYIEGGKSHSPAQAPEAPVTPGAPEHLILSDQSVSEILENRDTPTVSTLPSPDSRAHSLVPVTAPPPQPPQLSADRSSPMTRAQLEMRASAVEQDANRELARLLPLLDLSPAEQDRIFAIFAVTSPNYDPSMSVGAGRSALSRIRKAMDSGADIEKTRLDEIYEAVDEEDKIKIVDTYLEKEEWWSNIVADLESELDNTPLPGQTNEPTVLLASPETEAPPADEEISVTRPSVFPSE